MRRINGRQGKQQCVTRNYTGAAKKVAGLYRVAKEYGYEDVKVNVTKNGIVNYEWTEKRPVTKVHGINPQNNIPYERTTIHSGKIMPDGLVKRNISEVIDQRVKKGKH